MSVYTGREHSPPLGGRLWLARVRGGEPRWEEWYRAPCSQVDVTIPSIASGEQWCRCVSDQ